MVVDSRELILLLVVSQIISRSGIVHVAQFNEYFGDGAVPERSLISSLPVVA